MSRFLGGNKGDNSWTQAIFQIFSFISNTKVPNFVYKREKTKVGVILIASRRYPHIIRETKLFIVFKIKYETM